MASSSSCVRCLKPLAVDSIGELCPVCLASDDTSRSAGTPNSPIEVGATASFQVPPPPVEAFDNTVTQASPELPEARHPGDATNAFVDVEKIRPHAPTGYELRQRLGSGGMGDVYLAEDSTANRIVAMKFLQCPGNPGLVERFLSEVRSLARLDHPNIIRVLAHDFYRAMPYFTMEYAPGGTLSDRVKKQGPLDPAEAARLMVTLAHAIAAAHAEHILHRDLKPSNIVLMSDGTPKVSDFGLAKRMDEDDGLTATTGAIGTPPFMSPEQVSRRRFGAITEASDVYGLGATLYYLLTGRPPFLAADSHDEVTVRVVAEIPTRVRVLRPEVPLALEAIIMKCLEKKPGDRYPTATALAEDLEKFLAGRAPEAPQLTPPRRVRRWAVRQRVRIAAAAVAVAMTASVVFTLMPARPQDSFAEVERKLDAGQTVTLVGERQGPQAYSWFGSEGLLGRAETQDGSVVLKTHGLSLLQLVRDPRHKSYRLAADLRHLSGGPGAPAVGLFACLDAVTAPSGDTMYTVLFARYSDIWDDVERQTARLPVTHAVELQYITILARMNEMPNILSISGSGRPGLLFTAQDAPQVPWRTLILDVSLDGVSLACALEAGGEVVHVATVSPAELADARDRFRQEVGQVLGIAPAIPDWHPRRACGVWSGNSDVSIRNVTIQPTTTPTR